MRFTGTRTRAVALLLGLAVLPVLPGFNCMPTATFDVTAPAHGEFIDASSVTVEGTTNMNPVRFDIELNGKKIPYNGGGFWSHSMALDDDRVFQSIVSELRDGRDGEVTQRERNVVIVGESLAEDEFATHGVGIRFNESTFTSIDPFVSVISDIDFGSLLPTKLIDDEEIISNITIDVHLKKAPAIQDVNIGLDSHEDYVVATIEILGFSVTFRIDVEVDFFIGSHEFRCGLELTSDLAAISVPFSIEPTPEGPRAVDVVQLADASVNFEDVDFDFVDDGICDAFIIEDVIKLIVPDLEELAEEELPELINELEDDGRTRLEAAIEDRFSGLDLSDNVGTLFGSLLETPLTLFREDTDGISIALDTKFTPDCGFDPSVADITRSLAPSGPLPAFGATTPVLGEPYDLALTISTPMVNQALKALTECGLLTHSIYRLGRMPLTAGQLSQYIPGLGSLPPDTPLGMEVRAGLAPLVTGTPGPNGEMMDMRFGDFRVGIVTVDDETLFEAALTMRLGAGLRFDSSTRQFKVILGAPDPGEFVVEVLTDTLGHVPGELQATLPMAITDFLPTIAEAIDTVLDDATVPDVVTLEDLLDDLPLPEAQLIVDIPEISRTGEFLSVYINIESSVP